LLFASSVVAVAWVVSPATNEADPNETLTVATGIGVTVITAILIIDSLSAVMWAIPGPTVDTRPVVADTVATDGASVLQLTVRPVSTLPFASLVSADSWTGEP
jgi:hypothetical protein